MGQLLTFNGAILTKTNGLDVFLNSLEIKNKTHLITLPKLKIYQKKSIRFINFITH